VIGTAALRPLDLFALGLLALGACGPAGSSGDSASMDEPLVGTLILSGGQAGRLRPCGCTAPQQGGLARHAAVVDDAANGGGPVVALQVGPAIPAPVTPHDDLKADAFAGSFAAMGCRVLSPPTPPGRVSALRVGGARLSVRREDGAILVAALGGASSVRVTLPDRGRGVGVVEVRGTANRPALSARVVPLAPAWDASASRSRERVDSVLAWYRGRMKSETVLEHAPRLAAVRGGLAYVGSSACARCHPTIYRDWAETRHAGALHALEQREHHWDPECVTCHTVGWRRAETGGWVGEASGFRTPEVSAHLGGVGCEACHGPGSAHAAPTVGAPASIPRPRPGRETCSRCHDGENSPRFAAGFLGHYLPRVDHRGANGGGSADRGD